MSADVKMVRQMIVHSIILISSLIAAVFVWEKSCRSALADEQSTAQTLESARRAPNAASEKLVSVIGVGEFTRLMQFKADEEPKLWSKAKVHVYFDRGKYHIQLNFEKKLTRVSMVGDEKNFRVVDGKYDDVRFIADDENVYVIDFSQRIRPTGCGGQIFSRKQERDALAISGFPFSDPARLWKDLPDINQLITNVGADTITFTEAGAGRFHCTFPLGKSRAEFDVDRMAGFNAVTSRAVHPDYKHVFQRRDATWKQKSDTWYVTEMVKESDNRELDLEEGYFSREAFKYESFEVNVSVEANLFSLTSVPIPARTRFIDRRANPASQFQYWNGTELR